MLLNGGQFETSGSLILTTKNLLNMTVDNLSNQNLIDNINSSNYDNDYSIISLKNNATVKAGTGDINLIAKGIDINQGELVGNNISFSTSDGANFVGNNNPQGITFKDNNTIQIANASLETKNGILKLVAKNNMRVDNATITGNVDAIATNNILVKNSTITSSQAKLTANKNAVLEGNTINVD